jgi:hypothetical protein
VVVDLSTRKVLCTSFACGRTHDFRLYKDSQVRMRPTVKPVTDSGYTGVVRLHANAEHPRKSSKKHPLSKEDKTYNRALSRQRILNEHVIGALKRFKIIADRYRNRRRRFGLRFNLIAGIYNHDSTC